MRDRQIRYLYQMESFEEIHRVSEHKLRLAKGEIAFKAVCEDHVFYGESGEMEAVINTISYIRSDDKEERPVMFLWNGGPGSATSALHLECFGPYLMKQDEDGSPVYGLTEDAESILDICDLVYVDAVGVGYSRLLDPEKWDKYYSLDGDGRSNAFAVISWLNRHKRWSSPVYLCGESYGTTRVCRILEELARNPVSGNRMLIGLPIKGVILIGLALSARSDGRTIDEGIELLPAALPSMAATHWYHNLQGTRERDAFVEEAWAFAGEELLPALFAGEHCPSPRVKELADRLAYFTGMESGYFVKTGLKLNDIGDFMSQVAATKGLRVELNDARKTVPLTEMYNAVGHENVPFRIMNGLLAEKLEIETKRLYYTGNINITPGWNFESEAPMEYRKSNIQCLRDGMNRMPDMQVMTASGLYDLCTLMGNTRYLLSHNGLPAKNLKECEYPGGHGVYSSREGKRAFIADVRQMITSRSDLQKSKAPGNTERVTTYEQI